MNSEADALLRPGDVLTKRAWGPVFVLSIDEQAGRVSYVYVNRRGVLRFQPFATASRREWERDGWELVR